MEIKSLTLNNFRQFYGENKLDFSQNDQQNITIVLGKNGNGKTGIFRAILFALYGKEKLEQDPEGTEIDLVNKTKINENGDQPTPASVCLTFSHEGISYQVERHLVYDQKRKPHMYVKSTSLTYRDAKGDLKEETNASRINQLTEKILNSSISEFFFFDAEKMELLNNSKRKANGKASILNVKDSIHKLLQIDDLYKAVDIIKKAYDVTCKERDRGNQHEGHLDRLEQRRQELSAKIKESEQMVAEKRAELAQIASEMESNQQTIETNINAAGKTDLYKERQKRLDSEKEALHHAKENLGSVVKDFGDLLAQPILQRQVKHISELLKKRDDSIPISLLERSLDEHECAVCHQHLPETREDLLKELLKQRSYSQTTSILEDIKNEEFRINQEKEQKQEKIEQSLSFVVECEMKVKEAEEDVERSEKEVLEYGKFDSDVINSLKQQNAKLERQRDQISSIIGSETADQQCDKNELSKTEKSIENFESKDKEIQIKIEMIKRLGFLKTKTEQILNDYLTDIVKVLSTEMTAVFRQLISQKDLDTFDHVKVTKDFDIQLINRFGNDDTVNSSMGQGQILTLSFITTIAKVASLGRDEMVFPLLMDTPFGRLDKENRSNLIQLIPDLTKQWILLLTDTELSETEQALFNQGGRVGKVYELVNEDSKTRIIEHHDIMELDVRGEI